MTLAWRAVAGTAGACRRRCASCRSSCARSAAARDVREARCHGQARSPRQDASWLGVLGGMRPAARQCTPWAGKTGRTQAEVLMKLPY